MECYVLDNNGFVVISEDKLNTGKFFGEIDGTVLNSLVKNNVFKRIKIFDYQVPIIKSGIFRISRIIIRILTNSVFEIL